MNDDDEPDTTIYLDRAVTGPRHLPGPTACGCRPTAGESCVRCDGGGGNLTPREDPRRAWRAGEITARDYYHRTAAQSFDGLPSPDAVKALAREQRSAA